MAYRKKNYALKAHKTYRKKKTIMKLAPAIRRITYSIAEKKYFEFSGVAANVGTSWAYISAFDPSPPGNATTTISQGTGVANRIGNKIFVESITFHLHLTGTTTMDFNGIIGRFGIYHNTAAEGALPTSAETWNTNNVHSGRNLAKLGPVTFPKMVQHTMLVLGNNAGVVAAVGPPACFTLKIFPKKVVTFDSTTAGIASIYKDDYGLVRISSDGDAMQFAYNLVVQYRDA